MVRTMKHTEILSWPVKEQLLNEALEIEDVGRVQFEVGVGGIVYFNGDVVTTATEEPRKVHGNSNSFWMPSPLDEIDDAMEFDQASLGFLLQAMGMATRLEQKYRTRIGHA